MNEITKELLEALKGSIENAEQEAFESWLADKFPSGDAEQVKRQWEESSDLRDFLSQRKMELAVIAKAEATLTAPQSDDDGWIPWAGGERPVDTGVVVKFRSGGIGAHHARNYDWRHVNDPVDIVAYRVVRLSEETWGDEQRVNASLIAAAPELLQALKTLVKEAEESAFEAWLCQESPSGDSAKVNYSWKESSTFADFIAQYKTAIAAVGKAEGERE